MVMILCANMFDILVLCVMQGTPIWCHNRLIYSVVGLCSKIICCRLYFSVAAHCHRHAFFFGLANAAVALGIVTVLNFDHALGGGSSVFEVAFEHPDNGSAIDGSCDGV